MAVVDSIQVRFELGYVSPPNELDQQTYRKRNISVKLMLELPERDLDVSRMASYTGAHFLLHRPNKCL